MSQGQNESTAFYVMRVSMADRGWYVDGTREVLAADAGSVRVIYHADKGTWQMETGDPWSEAGAVLTVTVEPDWTVGAVRNLMEHMRTLAGLKTRW